ncbi:hypothetical protein [Wolbachia endosymbiont (group A) of Agelastica alni]
MDSFAVSHPLTKRDDGCQGVIQVAPIMSSQCQATRMTPYLTVIPPRYL